MPNKPIVFLHDTISEEKQKAFAVKRWQRDGVEALPPGVSLLPHGRAASIYLRVGDRFIAFDCEYSGVPDVDMEIYTEGGLTNWVDVKSFETTPTTAADRQNAWMRSVPGSTPGVRGSNSSPRHEDESENTGRPAPRMTIKKSKPAAKGPAGHAIGGRDCEIPFGDNGAMRVP